MPSHALDNFKIQKYCQKEPRFNGVDNLPKIKDGAYVINLDEYKSTGTDWIVLYKYGDNKTYFENF